MRTVHDIHSKRDCGPVQLSVGAAYEPWSQKSREGERTGDTEFVTVEDASAVASGLPFIIGIELHR
ncbi:hypothetical protein IMSAG025_02170 [Muribaculaceae bacterium]|nr:hypothetical protein IMSAGC016_00569 [Muribaculaceae bacterium]GFI58706.1 hypothetical protein IMSAG025_02170 [Muribaculaceae bacterium]